MRKTMVIAASVYLLLPSFAMAQPSAPVDGWGKLKFGMSVEEVRKVPGLLWEDYPCKDKAAIALNGCTLTPRYSRENNGGKGGSDTVTLDGMPFEPNAIFDRWGRLKQIRLGFRQENSSLSTCQALFTRTIDNLEKRYGPFSTRIQEQTKESIDAGIERTEHRTSAGSTFAVSTQNRGGRLTYFDGSRMSNDHAARDEHVALLRQNSPKGGPRPYVQTSFYGVMLDGDSSPRCTIDITYESADMPAPATSASDGGHGF